MDNTESVLRRAPLFDGLDDEGARALRRQMAEVKLSRGEHLFMEGDDGDALYVVMEGEIEVLSRSEGGRQVRLGNVRAVWGRLGGRKADRHRQNRSRKRNDSLVIHCFSPMLYRLTQGSELCLHQLTH